MSKIPVICENCNKIFTIDEYNLKVYRNIGINPYECPNCHSLDCRNMIKREINIYNKKIDIENKKNIIKNRLKEFMNDNLNKQF